MSELTRAELAAQRISPKRYRKGKTIIDAVQLTPDNGAEVWEWADSKPLYHRGIEAGATGLRVFAPGGDQRALYGDYVVRDVKTGAFFVVVATDFWEWSEQASQVEGRT